MSNSASGAARSLVISTVIVWIEVIDQQSKTEHWWRSGVNLTNSRSFMMLNNPSHLEVKYGDRATPQIYPSYLIVLHLKLKNVVI